MIRFTRKSANSSCRVPAFGMFDFLHYLLRYREKDVQECSEFTTHRAARRSSVYRPREWTPPCESGSSKVESWRGWKAGVSQVQRWHRVTSYPFCALLSPENPSIPTLVSPCGFFHVHCGHGPLPQSKPMRLCSLKLAASKTAMQTYSSALTT